MDHGRPLQGPKSYIESRIISSTVASESGDVFCISYLPAWPPVSCKSEFIGVQAPLLGVHSLSIRRRLCLQTCPGTRRKMG